MCRTRLFGFGLLICCFLSSCTKYAFHFISPDYRPELLNQTAVITPYLYQGIIQSGNKVELKDSLNYQVATLLEEQLPKYLTGIENMLPISLSPKTRRDLEKYLFSVRLDNEYNLKKTRRVRVPEQICEEIQQDGSRFVIVFVSDGFSRTMNNYSSLASLERVTKTALSASAMVLSPYRTGMTSRRSIQPHSSSLELFVLDVLKQEILKYQRDRLDLPPTNPFTIRQHLTALFLE